MRQIDFIPTENFKKELNNIELEGIERILDSIGKNYSDDFEMLHLLDSDTYGLAYTSSSAYAMYNVTEKIFFGDGEISHFAITTNGMLIMVTGDDNEFVTYYEIEPSDF